MAVVDSANGPIYLWAAPTDDGRHCWLTQVGDDPATGRPYGVTTCDDAAPATPLTTPDPMFWTDERPARGDRARARQ